MKVRAGFVSNSSSSSFCIFGCHWDDVVDILKKKALEAKPDLYAPNDPHSVCWAVGLRYYPSYNGKVCGIDVDSTIDDLVKVQKKLIDIIGDGYTLEVITGEWAD